MQRLIDKVVMSLPQSGTLLQPRDHVTTIVPPYGGATGSAFRDGIASEVVMVNALSGKGIGKIDRLACLNEAARLLRKAPLPFESGRLVIIDRYTVQAILALLPLAKRSQLTLEYLSRPGDPTFDGLYRQYLAGDVPSSNDGSALFIALFRPFRPRSD